MTRKVLKQSYSLKFYSYSLLTPDPPLAVRNKLVRAGIGVSYYVEHVFIVAIHCS